MKTLEGKIALITGSGRGIGRAIALKLAGEGASIVVNDLDTIPAEETVTAIRKLGAKAHSCVGSITDPGFGERFVQCGIEEFGGLDIIVNNAGYIWDNVIQKMTDEQWDAILDVHLTAPFRILRAASEFIRRTAKGEAAAGKEVFRKVVNVSSISAICGNAGQANYASAKAGIIGLTHAMCKEWGRYKVNVNCVAFGFIKTRLTEPSAASESSIDIGGRQIPVGVNPDLIRVMEASIPLGRVGTPEEAAGAVYLLCTPESNYITGQVLVCGGGFLM